MRYSDIVSFTEIAARAGVSVATVKSWRNRHSDFPEPIAMLAVGPIFNWIHIAGWLKRNPRTPGRPRKIAV